MSAEEKPNLGNRRRGRIGNEITGPRGAAAVIGTKDGQVSPRTYVVETRDLNAGPRIVVEGTSRHLAMDPYPPEKMDPQSSKLMAAIFGEKEAQTTQRVARADDDQVRSAAKRLLKKRMGLMTALAHR
ncbi:hypothetical protein [Aureimonas sp. AU40]|uniref:hypothetical protein n=1 Tax=Aureimonas sp. AU40 TaxID=1637747 RepID=UPI000780DCEB|nr:hypothetical protein [Aureimonas sp. AU40]